MAFSTTLYHNGNHLSFLHDITRWADKVELGSDLLFRSSEITSLDKILKFGSDRCGFPDVKPWAGNLEFGQNYSHDEIIIATTKSEILRGERDPAFSHSFKKFNFNHQPLVLLYDSTKFEKIHEKNYRFLNQNNKPAALLAIIEVIMCPAI